MDFSEFVVGPEIFEEIPKNNVTMSESALSGLTPDKVAELSAFFAEALTPPGHMQMDEAKGYMARIVALFGEDEVKVCLALAGWSALHDVGAVQDFGGKPPIVCGSKFIPAIDVFGGIIPVGKEGKPRQFCGTMFEKHADVILAVFPQLGYMLAARSAEAGLAASDPKSVISYIKGVTPGTAGSGAARTRAKRVLLSGNALSARGSGAAIQAEEAVQPHVSEVSSSGHNLYG